MANGWTAGSVTAILVVAFALGVYFGFRQDGGGEEYGELAFLRAA